MKKRTLLHRFALTTASTLLLAGCLTVGASAQGTAPVIPDDIASQLAETDPYVDFSSDRSTWFFDLDGTGSTVFCDFFSPFDPYTKVETYDPLIRYQLDQPYSVSGSDLLLGLEELEKLYDPYFAYAFHADEDGSGSGTLYLRYTLYEKLEIDGFGARSTKLLYYKHVWDMALTVDDSGEATTGTCTHTTFDPALGGRNLGDFTIDPDTASYEETEVTLTTPVTLKDGVWTAPVNQLMAYMGKDCYESEGYLHIQTADLVDVTKDMTLEDRQPLAEEYLDDFDVSSWEGLTIPEIVVPDASNSWHSGCYEEFDPDYTWADYMDDVVSGERKTGWLWQAFYLATEDADYVDLNGQPSDVVADRIVPFNLYVPTGYDADTTRLVYMLHGGTGNENTATYRLMIRDEDVTEVDSLAEAYNYIIVSPNGWTQNPMWRENQALQSFLTASEMVMEQYPVDEDKVFLTGNSMGGKGTFEIAMRYPDMFQAIAPTAAKIADRVGNKNECNIDDSTVYSLEKNLADMPVMMAQGNVDTTTSFKVQIGGPTFEGMITTYVMPYLNNATYITVESGSHPHAYGAVLPAIFDFFEKQLDPDEDLHTFDTLTVSDQASDTVYLDGAAYTLAHSTQVVDGTVMMAVSDLEALYGEDFRLYYIDNYNEDPAKMRNYYMIIHDNQVLNFMTPQTANPATDPEENLTLYRKNMERYIEDGQRMDSWEQNPEPLENQPRFSTVPFEQDGQIYLPVQEAMAALGETVSVTSASSGSSGGSSEPTTFAVNVAPCANGSVQASKTWANAGQTVTLTVTPDAGYRLASLSVSSEGGSVSYEKQSDTSYSFQMPKQGVTVTAVFAPLSAAPVYTDVDANAWYYAAVMSVCDKGVLTGTSDTTFSPQLSFSRAMMAQVLYSLAGKPAVSAQNSFTDVPADAWYAQASAWCREQGLISGYGDGTFGSDDAITREQLALMLYRYAGAPQVSGDAPAFADWSQVSTWAQDAMQWAVQQGLLSGTGSGLLNPLGTASRAEVAQMLANYLA